MAQMGTGASAIVVQGLCALLLTACADDSESFDASTAQAAAGASGAPTGQHGGATGTAGVSAAGGSGGSEGKLGGAAGSAEAGQGGGGVGGDSAAGGPQGGVSGGAAGETAGGNAGQGAGSGGSGSGGGAGTSGGQGGASGATGGGGGAVGGSAPVFELSLETFNAGLYGSFAPAEPERLEALLAAASTFESDVLCLTEVMGDETFEKVLAAFSSVYPHAHYLPTTPATPCDSPEGLGGSIPAQPTTAPCPDDATTERLDTFVDCLRDKFSTTGGDDGHVPNGADVAGGCTPEGLSVIGAPSPDAHRCWMCAYAGFTSYEQLSTIRTSCRQAPDALFAFRGGSSALLLSKVPLAEKRAWVLPATTWQRVLLEATVDAGGAPLRVHCGSLTPVVSVATRPYPGVYGDGESTSGWENEQRLQATKVVAHIAEGGGATVLLGEFFTGPGREEGGQPLYGAINEPAYQTLTSALPPVTAPGYEPLCTLCADNPLVGGVSAASTLTNHILGRGLEGFEIIATERTHEAPVVDVIYQGNPVKAPLSNRYGLRSVLRRSQ